MPAFINDENQKDEQVQAAKLVTFLMQSNHGMFQGREHYTGTIILFSRLTEIIMEPRSNPRYNKS